MQRRRDSSTEAAVTRASAELDAIDTRVGEARVVRNAAREPLAEALRRALKPSYGEAARLLREADERLLAARHILAVAEDFAGRSGVELTSFTWRVPTNMSAVAGDLEARG
jgi:hypothetical protein